VLGAEPAKGLTVTQCVGAELTSIQKLWAERGGSYEVMAVWTIENPQRTWKYRSRQAELQSELGRAPTELRGFHGSSPCNILAIAENGFDAGRRAGQAFGAGEYFAKNPSVSVGYCRGGSYMLVCQLCLGHESSSEQNADGDHIWVPRCGYYVISSPDQVLPLYIVRFKNSYDGVRTMRPSVVPGQDELTSTLASPCYRSGDAEDNRMIDLEFEHHLKNEMEIIEARPAAWWNGDIVAFGGQLFFDPDNVFGEQSPLTSAAKGRVVVFQRGGGATFLQKEACARNAGASSMLVVQSSVATGQPLCMTATTAQQGSEPSLAAAMVSHANGQRLIQWAMRPQGAKLRIARRRAAQVDVPANRPCAMTADATDALWLGYLHAHFSDKQLESDVNEYLCLNLPEAVASEIRIVRGKYTQAKVQLDEPVAREHVLVLNSKPIIECGTERLVTVDDSHGSPGQRCPRSIAKYCRGQNLRFVDPCWCQHADLPTARAVASFQSIALESAKGDEVRSSFLGSSPFHDGTPEVVEIQSVHNPQLEKQHALYRRYLADKNGEAPREVDLYHGTNMNILETVYTHGLFPPSDMEACEDCPVSGGKSLRTSLCNNDCKFCTKPHVWDRCHMYGLGIYLGDMAQKSHRYVSARETVADGRRKCKLVVCSVVLGDALQLEGHLKCGNAMHSVQSLRRMGAKDVPKKLDLVGAFGGKRPVDQRDILFVKGLGASCKPGFSVFNSEFISFHPYQCLPRYEITYLI